MQGYLLKEKCITLKKVRKYFWILFLNKKFWQPVLN